MLKLVALWCHSLSQTLAPLDTILAANPALFPSIIHLVEALCAAGWEGTLAGQPRENRTFLAPYRFWFQTNADAPVQRGLLVACSPGEEGLVAMDVALDGSSPVVVPVDAVVASTKSQTAFRARSDKLSVLPWVHCLKRAGFALDGERPVDGFLFPPRSVTVDDAGARGRLVGWQPDNESFIVGRGLLAPVFMNSGVGDDGAYSVMTIQVSSIITANPGISLQKLHTARDFLLDHGILCNGVLLPPSTALSIPDANFKHLSCGDDGRYLFQCPGDVCRVFAAKTIYQHVDVFDSSGWDISAAVPSLVACRLESLISSGWTL